MMRIFLFLVLFFDVHVGSGKQSDLSYSTDKIETIREKELYIRDLGYFRLKNFGIMQSKEAYW